MNKSNIYTEPKNGLKRQNPPKSNASPKRSTNPENLAQQTLGDYIIKTYHPQF